MRGLVECLEGWLAKDREDGAAYTLLVALTKETAKRADSADPGQREFDAQDLAAAAGRPEGADFDASKRWVDRAKMEKFAGARQASIEAHFAAAGHAQCLRPVRRSPGGKHRAVWFLEAYPLPVVEVLESGAEEAKKGSDSLGPVAIEYEFTEPGHVKAAWYVRPLIGSGSFATRSWRGLLWLGLVLIPIAYIALTTLFAVGHLYLRRPLQTSDLASFVLAGLFAWIFWRLFVRPTMWLLDDRIIPATEAWVGWREDNAQLELTRDTAKRIRLQLVRYSAVCQVCAGKVELRYSQGTNRRQLLGCCVEAPHDHVFSFDRVLRRGRRLIPTGIT
jgi:hypothetical protein